MTLVKLTDRHFPGSSIFDTFFNRELMDWNHSERKECTAPAVNILNNKDDYSIEIAAPGLKKEDFKIDLTENNLTISSEGEEKKEVKNNAYSRREFHYSKFSRSFTLPENEIKREEISANYTDGILSVVIPKNKDEKRNQKIDITVG